jgi:hypothetical protein
MKDENAQIPALKSQVSTLQSEISSLKAEIARLKSGPARPVQGWAIPAGTLLAENARAMQTLKIDITNAQLLLRKGEGPWNLREFVEKVVGQAALVVLVESELGVCGGFAAVAFPDKEREYVADPSGATCVFSIKPTTARYPLEYKAGALYLGSDVFSFAGCLGIYSGGVMARREFAYAVPSGWATDLSSYPKFTRFECWRVTL